MKKIQVLLLTIFIPLTVMATTAHADCPLGAKETHLTIQRVMRNFGRFTSYADMIAIKSLTPYEVNTDADISLAIEKLNLAIDCAQAVLDNPTGDIIPTEMRSKPEAELKAYMADFLYFMTDFHDLLIEYRDVYKKILLVPSANRDFKPAQDKRNEVNKLVDHAHRKV